MKKFLMMLMAVAMLLSVGSIFASAALPENVEFKDGKYCVENPDDFTPVGDIRITWDPDVSSKLDLSDGDMSDWAKAGYNMITVNDNNMISWVGDMSTMPSGWDISTYFVADSEWLYIGFYVTDPDFVYATGLNQYDGDAFQVCIDFGGKLGFALENDPYLLEENPKNIFYSFSCFEDGAPLQIRRQEADKDEEPWLSEANGNGVKGTARKTDSGWSAEFALSFEMLYDDYVWKAYETDPKIYIGGEQDLPLTIGCCLYYLDRSVVDGKNTTMWAAGTTNGIMKDDGTPVVSWTAYDNGINLYLPYEEGMKFNSENLVVIAPDETVPLETAAPETEAPETKASATQTSETQAQTEPATNAEAVSSSDQESTASNNETDSADADSQGCSSVVGMSLAVVMVTAAAAVVLKKKD